MQTKSYSIPGLHIMIDWNIIITSVRPIKSESPLLCQDRKDVFTKATIVVTLSVKI